MTAVGSEQQTILQSSPLKKGQTDCVGIIVKHCGTHCSKGTWSEKRLANILSCIELIAVTISFVIVTQATAKVKGYFVRIDKKFSYRLSSDNFASQFS